MAIFPTAVATDADLHVAVNLKQTTLNGAINNVTTTIVLTSASGFPTAGYVTIDSENIRYTGISTNTLTGVTRGADGTTAASHLNAAVVEHTVVAAHHNVLKDEIIAIESNIPSGSVSQPNLLINGAFILDQKKEGAVHTINNGVGTSIETIDGVRNFGLGTGVFTVQRLSATPPTGFTYYMQTKTTTADAVMAAGDYYTNEIYTEAVDNAPLLWGSAAAKTVSLSFWARSSLTGTFSGNVQDYAGNRHWVFTYSIPVANTWAYYSFVIPGDTGNGSDWVTGVGQLGLQVAFDFGGGSTWETPNPQVWEDGDKFRVAGSTNLISTLNATHDMTGIQLQIGPAPTSFCHVPFNQLLQRCQRYYRKSYPVGVALGAVDSTNYESIVAAQLGSPFVASGVIRITPEMAGAPTVTLYSVAGVSGKWTWYSSAGVGTARNTSVNIPKANGFEVVQTAANEFYATGHWAAQHALVG